jgi:hypothetical protein
MHVDNYAVVGSGHSCGGFSDLGGGSGNAWLVLLLTLVSMMKICGGCDHVSIVALVIVVMALVKVRLFW